MKPIYKILALLCYFSIGLCTPVQTLLMCEHGCTLQNVGLTFTIFAVTVIIAEIPSGVFADLRGRRLSFILSRVMEAASAAMLIVSDSFWLSAAAFATAGFAVAFASGSLDALAVEDAVRRGGKGAMTKAVSQFSVCQCAGVACGALAAGFIPYVPGYALHLEWKCALSLLTAVVSFALPEDVRKPSDGGGRIKLGEHIGRVSSLLRQSSAIKVAVVCIAATVTVQTAVETYWQPRFVEINGGAGQGALGVLMASSYIASTGGCALMGLADLKDESRRWETYLLLSAGFAFAEASLSFISSSLLFSALYVAAFLLIGLLTVPEQTIINAEATDDVRATVLSVTSFAARVGAMVSGTLGSLLLLAGNVAFVWRVMALLAFAGLAAAYVMRRASSGKDREATM